MRNILLTLCIILAISISTAWAGSDVTLQWDANTEADLAGYKIYYGTTTGGPYNGTGAVEGPSPVDVFNVTTFTLHGLPDGMTFFVATAYDTELNESAYSNEVFAKLDTVAPAPPQNCLIKAIVKILEQLGLYK